MTMIWLHDCYMYMCYMYMFIFNCAILIMLYNLYNYTIIQSILYYCIIALLHYCIIAITLSRCFNLACRNQQELVGSSSQLTNWNRSLHSFIRLILSTCPNIDQHPYQTKIYVPNPRCGTHPDGSFWSLPSSQCPITKQHQLNRQSQC